MGFRVASVDDLPSQHREQARAQIEGAPAPRPREVPVAPSVVPSEKPRKFRNEIVVLDGYTFDSKFQAKRYQELKNMQVAGLITDLRLEPSYALHVNGQRIGAIEPDFDYRRAGKLVVEDTKSKITKTPIYEWKRAHLLAEYGIEIVEIERRKRKGKT